MNWFKRTFPRNRPYEELSATIRENLDEKIADLMDRGLTREEAERTAQRKFGNVTQIEECSREIWQWPTLESALADKCEGTLAISKLNPAPFRSISETGN